VHSWLVAMGNICSRLPGRVWAAHHARHAPHTPPPPVQCRAVREHGWLASEGTGGTWQEAWSEHTLSAALAVPCSRASLTHTPSPSLYTHHLSALWGQRPLHAPGEEPGTEATVVPSPEPLNSPSKPEDHGWLLL